ncbi:hypothetical protein LSH36_26g10056 [Paralvinella palmiformis]|uniref:Uncharacterized protein n=1 Tax=Paralvinella palmiformis TaxID=53620 RepID=A0AAD9KA83_9ANNE|nr:hypothetical protein LSH36_26g10056 [Paralvinella palmiformis]
MSRLYGKSWFGYGTGYWITYKDSMSYWTPSLGRAMRRPYDDRPTPSDTWRQMNTDNVQDDAKKKDALRTIADNYASHTSLQGVPFISRAGRWYTKTFWTVIFLGALAAMLQQTFQICEKYYSYKTTSSVSIGYDKLPFPSVTICNINPIRRSKVNELGGPIAAFVSGLLPRTGYGYAWDVQTNTEATIRNEDLNEPNSGMRINSRSRKKRQIQCNPADPNCKQQHVRSKKVPYSQVSATESSLTPSSRTTTSTDRKTTEGQSISTSGEQPVNTYRKTTITKDSTAETTAETFDVQTSASRTMVSKSTQSSIIVNNATTSDKETDVTETRVSGLSSKTDTPSPASGLSTITDTPSPTSRTSTITDTPSPTFQPSTVTDTPSPTFQPSTVTDTPSPTFQPATITDTPSPTAQLPIPTQRGVTVDVIVKY